MTPEPEISAELDRVTRSTHAGKSGSSQSGTVESDVSDEIVKPFDVRPHTFDVNTSGDPPSPGQMESFVQLRVVGFAMANASSFQG